MSDRSRRKILRLAMEWVDARYIVAEALIEQELRREIRMLKKERRDALGEEGEKEQEK